MCLTPLSSFVPKIRTPGLKLVACWSLWLRLLVGTIHLSALLSNTVSIKNRDRLGSSETSRGKFNQCWRQTAETDFKNTEINIKSTITIDNFLHNIHFTY